ncbi:MAG: FAD-dependent oxidoreductase [Oscillospiraceae bacterium]|nr:FAD-dependent oxidoreductase [Oscillospiraceae bacterium]
MKYVIIGNSHAAAGAVEGIRNQDAQGEILLISKEAHHVYSRPLISYLLQGKTDLDRMKYRPDDFYEKNSCQTLFGVCADSIDPGSRSVTLDNGNAVSYDKLLVATGSRPFVPNFPGLDSVPKCFSFMSLSDALALEEALFPEARVLIVGAGLIGLKCAEGISSRVGEITVIDLAARVLPSILDEEGAKMTQALLEQNGISFRLGVSAERFEKNRAILTDGTQLDFDLLVLAVGVRPNTGLVAQAGGKCNRGIIVDKAMQTTLPDVYAAGDCVESYDVSSAQNKMIAIVPTAYSGGFNAGVAMAGGRSPEPKAVPMNAIGFFGQHIITAGSYEGDFYESRGEGTYKKLFYSDNLLRGFILIGDVDKAGIYTSLLREKTPLDSIDFDLVCEKPSLVAFSRGYRDKNLGGKPHEFEKN